MEFEQIGKYKILAEIGQGAMGVVYRAHDPILNRHVAIKTISASLGSDDELRKRFHREAQAAARLNHPNIITVFDFGEEHGKIYMAMELLEGTDLKDIMAAGTLTTLDDKLAITEQILDGLAFAHAKEVVHRDLKPGNIHIQPNGQIKIMDFGLARLGSSEMTQAGVVMGTPNYMSPEQVLGEKVDSRSDIFAMGAVFYELLTGHKPFEAESMHGVLFQVVHKDPQPARKWAPDLPPVLVQIVEKCLVKDKNKRFQNAGEMREAVVVARQALVAGRISEATLDMESAKVFFEAEEFVDDDAGASAAGAAGQKSWPPRKGEQKWVEGTVALDEAPDEEADEAAPAQRSHPTLSGRSRTQVNRQRTQRGLPQPVAAPSRMPLYIGGAILVVGLAVGIGLYLRGPGRGGAATPVVQLLIQTRNELAQNALDNKEYKKAIETVESTLTMAKGENVADDYADVVKAKKILEESRTKFTAIETTATDAEDAFSKGELETAATKLAQLLELNPQHPVAQELSGKLNQQFQAQADDARRAMAQAKDQADKINSSATAEFRAEGRADFAKGNAAADAAQAAQRNKAYAQATQKFLEARDAYDRARRAVEMKMADAAQKDAQALAALKVPAEEAQKSTARAKSAAEQAGAATSSQARDEFRIAVARAADGDSAMGKNDYLAAKRAFDDARAAFDRARTAALRTPPPPPSVAPSLAPTAAPTLVPSAAPSVPPSLAPSVAPPSVAPSAPPLPPPIGRLEAGTKDRGRGAFGGVETEFKGTLEFEFDQDVRPGQPYTIKVYVLNEGSKSARIRKLTVNTRLNAQGTPQEVNPENKSVDPGKKVLLAELKGTWPDAIRSWTTTVNAYSDKDEYCEARIVFRRQ